MFKTLVAVRDLFLDWLGRRSVSALGATAALAPLAAAFLAWLGPRAAAPHLSALNRPGVLTYATHTIGQGYIPVPLFEEENPVVSVNMPAVIQRHETASVELSIREVIESLALMNGEYYSELTLAPSLQGPAFEISPSSEPIEKMGKGVVSWDWLIRPQEVGKHLIRLDLGEALISERSIKHRQRQLDHGDDGLILHPDSVVGQVTVLTSLGLTATQDAWSKALGALLGVIGTVLAYPFLKQRLEGRRGRGRGRVTRVQSLGGGLRRHPKTRGSPSEIKDSRD